MNVDALRHIVEEYRELKEGLEELCDAVPETAPAVLVRQCLPGVQEEVGWVLRNSLGLEVYKTGAVFWGEIHCEGRVSIVYLDPSTIASVEVESPQL